MGRRYILHCTCYSFCLPFSLTLRHLQCEAPGGIDGHGEYAQFNTNAPEHPPLLFMPRRPTVALQPHLPGPGVRIAGTLWSSSSRVPPHCVVDLELPLNSATDVDKPDASEMAEDETEDETPGL
jgi:hypothetical protein